MLELLYYLGLSLLIQLIMFVPAFIFKTDKLTDLSYGLTFIILALLVFLLNPFSWAGLILLAMVVVWGLRLAGYLFIRINKMKKDERFDGIREKFFRFLSFWMIQGVSVWIILLPAMLFFGRERVSVTMLLGFLVWLSGLTIETIADRQKFRFYNDSVHRGEWISHGVWKYSRHPNYFGEILCWVGVYLFTFSFSINSLIGLASPLFIAFLIIFVSGIPKLEQGADKKWGQRVEYQDYKKHTSVLVPTVDGMWRYVALYALSFLFMLAIDLVWLGVLMKGFYQAQFAPIAREATPLLSAILAWVLIALGVFVFVLPRANKSVEYAFMYGGLYGFVLYGLYGFTNFVTIQNWTLEMLSIDIAWGTVLCAVVSVFACYVQRRLFR